MNTPHRRSLAATALCGVLLLAGACSADDGDSAATTTAAAASPEPDTPVGASVDGSADEYCAFSIALDPGGEWADDQWEQLIDLAPEDIRADIELIAGTMAGVEAAEVTDAITGEVLAAAETVSAWEVQNCSVLAPGASAPGDPGS